MKIWKAFGSAHSANLTIIGQFKNIRDAEFIKQIIEDFVNAPWNDLYPQIKDARYPEIEVFIPDKKAFVEYWRSRLDDTEAGAIEMLGPNQSDFFLGNEQPPDVIQRENMVKVTGIRSMDITGIIKLMFLRYPDEVKISGVTGP